MTITHSQPELHSRHHRPTGSSGILRVARAELLRLRRWPAVWVTVATWLLLTSLFGYVFNYVSYLTGDESFANEGVPSSALLHDVLPINIGEAMMQGTPMFGGALLMVLGALVAGSGFSWGTWKTSFIHGPSRALTVLGNALALAVVVVTTVLVTLVMCIAFSTGIGLIEGQPLTWPGLSDLLLDVGASALILLMWASVGFFLGILAKGPALSVGLGLVWALAIENLLRGVGSVLGPIEAFTTVLPGTSAGSLVGALVGADASGEGAPGVLTTVGAGQATWTIVAWIIAAIAMSVVVVRRRDVT
ncbi:ABC transporter permease subunit [Cumulibacter soli]|uniref:ABC transporter permease subunit n=1 Tax=Cumulibacter soli TaxID=2546344 RepID=UPI00106841BE|nr:ABC transporter permease subunit [Cumulibacter soli]